MKANTVTVSRHLKADDQDYEHYSIHGLKRDELEVLAEDGDKVWVPERVTRAVTLQLDEERENEKALKWAHATIAGMPGRLYNALENDGITRETLASYLAGLYRSARA